ncbi:hypothetical protein [Acidobacterium sp. S8]|uniref:hypothetical protein n=1 Tax=Acidobacterium sp. S8 TaxID=1641854 RepID=UPI00131BB61C|nr:hypothetical protein [Acidobacterium sp. S8]
MFSILKFIEGYWGLLSRIAVETSPVTAASNLYASTGRLEVWFDLFAMFSEGRRMVGWAV